MHMVKIFVKVNIYLKKFDTFLIKIKISRKKNLEKF